MLTFIRKHIVSLRGVLRWGGAITLMALCVQGFAQEHLLVAAGAGYKRPVDAIAQAFEASSKAKVERFYGHMGQVLAQAKAGNSVAVVIGEQDALAGGEVAFSRFVPLGMGRLVVAWPRGKTLKSPADIVGSEFARIGVADTKQAIFGKAAIEYLQHSGLYAPLEKRLMTVSTVPQVSAYLVSGEIDAGFINLTEALAIHDKIGGYLEIPAASYTSVHIVGGVVSGQETPLAKAFVEYLQTPAAQDVFKHYGL
jgi:molybdate transport system substrate-binding protein